MHRPLMQTDQTDSTPQGYLSASDDVNNKPHLLIQSEGLIKYVMVVADRYKQFFIRSPAATGQEVQRVEPRNTNREGHEQARNHLLARNNNKVRSGLHLITTETWTYRNRTKKPASAHWNQLGAHVSLVNPNKIKIHDVDTLLYVCLINRTPREYVHIFTLYLLTEILPLIKHANQPAYPLSMIRTHVTVSRFDNNYPPQLHQR